LNTLKIISQKLGAFGKKASEQPQFRGSILIPLSIHTGE